MPTALAERCSSLPDDPIEPHNVNRELLERNDALDDALKMLETEVDMERAESREGMCSGLHIRCAVQKTLMDLGHALDFEVISHGACLYGVLPVHREDGA